MGIIYQRDKRVGITYELDTIELFEAPGHGRVLGEVTEKQAILYKSLGVEPPSL